MKRVIDFLNIKVVKVFLITTSFIVLIGIIDEVVRWIGIYPI